MTQSTNRAVLWVGLMIVGIMAAVAFLIVVAVRVYDAASAGHWDEATFWLILVLVLDGGARRSR